METSDKDNAAPVVRWLKRHQLGAGTFGGAKGPIPQFTKKRMKGIAVVATKGNNGETITRSFNTTKVVHNEGTLRFKPEPELSINKTHVPVWRGGEIRWKRAKK